MGQPRSGGFSDFKTEQSQMVSIEALLSSTYVSQNVAKSMANVTSQSCGDLQPAVCLSRRYGPFKDHPSTRGRMTRSRNQPQEKQTEEPIVMIPT